MIDIRELQRRGRVAQEDLKRLRGFGRDLDPRAGVLALSSEQRTFDGLAIDGVLYDETPNFAGNATDRGLFQRQAGQIEFHPFFNPATAATHPLRLIINGAESQPFWFTTP